MPGVPEHGEFEQVLPDIHPEPPVPAVGGVLPARSSLPGQNHQPGHRQLDHARRTLQPAQQHRVQEAGAGLLLHPLHDRQLLRTRPLTQNSIAEPKDGDQDATIYTRCKKLSIFLGVCLCVQVVSILFL